MCLTTLKNKYDLWIDSKPMHPVWLELKEKEVQDKFDVMIRIHVYKICKFVCIVHWIYLVFGLGLNYGKEFEDQALFIFHIGSLSASLTVLILLAKIRLSILNYAGVFIIVVRVIETFGILHKIEQGAPGFGSVDKKELSDSIQFVASPALIFAICKFKFNVIVAVPLVVVSIIIAN